MRKRAFFLFGIVVMGTAIFTQPAYAQEAAPDVIVLKSGNEIEAVIQEIGIDTVRYTRASNPNGPVVTIPKSEIFMIRYANGEKEVFNEEPKSLFGGSSTGDYKQHRFGGNLGIGGLTYEGGSGGDLGSDSLFTFELGGSYTYMFRRNLGLNVHLRPFFAGSNEGDIKQDVGGFQAMAGIRYIFPAIYKTSQREIAPYAAGKIGFGYVNAKVEYGEEIDDTSIDVKAELDGGAFCFELELGLEMNAGLYIAFVYNYLGGTLKGKVDIDMGSEISVSENISSSFRGNFVGFRVGYQF